MSDPRLLMPQQKIFKNLTIKNFTKLTRPELARLEDLLADTCSLEPADEILAAKIKILIHGHFLSDLS